MLTRPIYLCYIFLGITSLSLAIVFASAGFLYGLVGTIIVSVSWGIIIWRSWNLGSILCMLILILGISLGAMLEGSRLILLITVLALLATWDLAAFQKQLSSSKNTADEDQITRTHLSRLAIIICFSFVLPLLAFGLQIDLKFWQVFLLGILLLAGLSLIFTQLKRSNN